MENKIINKRRHHYVWQYYLKAFCHNADFIYCLIYGEVKSICTKHVAVEKDLYRLKELTKDEAKYLKLLFQNENNPLMNKMTATFVNIFNSIFLLKSQFPQGELPKEIADKIDEAEHNLSENLHMNIEGEGVCFIDSLRNEDTSFFNDEEKRAKFILFIMVQYCRTKKTKDTIGKVDGKGYIDFEKAWNIIVHIIASGVGMTVYSESENWELLGLNNKTEIPFITSDQPVINLHATEKIEKYKKLSHDEFELYYPITPKYSVVLKLKNKAYLNYSNLDQDTVTILNSKIKESSHIQVFSNSREYLESIRNKPSSVQC